MAPPAKRQKRPIVLSSDHEESDAKSTRKPIPITSRVKPTKSNNGSSSTATQPDPNNLLKDHIVKPKSAGSSKISRPISSFFGAGTQVHRQNGQKPPEAVTTVTTVTPELEDHEDLIVDDSSVEDVNDSRGTTTTTALDRRKKHEVPAYDKTAATKKPSLRDGSQKFKIPEHAISTAPEPRISSVVESRSTALDLRPWAEKYGPNNLEELMIHKKKVSDVRHWLENVLWGQYCKVRSFQAFVVQSLTSRKRLLILKGPSGAGKTATITMLAKIMGIDVSEWKNPVGSDFSSEAYLSMSAHFEDFLGRSGKFNKLALADSNGNFETPIPTADAVSESTRKKIILMEEFPNTFLSTSSALRSFRSCVLQYLAFNTPSMATLPSRKQDDYLDVTPVVMVITETRLTTSTAASDSFTAHRLLGPELLSHPSVSTIDFNPVASTYLTKALDLVIQKEARRSGRRRVPGPAVLKKLGEVGDIRSAIGSLEFLCLRGKDGDDWGGRVVSRAKKGATGSTAMTKMETESLEMVVQRESTLGLFHAVGKVVYNKRDNLADGDTASEHPTQPPRHLSGHVRLRSAQVAVDRLIDETGTDVATFIAALHENFVLSCEGISFADNLDGCIDALSDSDILGSLRGARFGSSGDLGNRTFQGAPSETLRQDEICFQVAVRGLLFALPDPVKRRTHPMSGNSECKNETHRMFYPTSMRLSAQMEEIDGLVSQWTQRVRACAVSLMGSRRQQVSHLPLGWEVQTSKLTAEHPSQTSEDDPEPFRTSLGCTKSELIVEGLPYITKIEQRRAASTHLNGLERITKFHGITPPGNEASENADIGKGDLFGDWINNGLAEGSVNGFAPSAGLQRSVGQADKAASTLLLPIDEEVGQLYLSDDDIEDD